MFCLPGMARTLSFVCARKIWLIAATLSASVEIKNKKGKSLILADALSRPHDDEAARALATIICDNNSLKELEVDISLSNVEFAWN